MNCYINNLQLNRYNDKVMNEKREKICVMGDDLIPEHDSLFPKSDTYIPKANSGIE